MMSNTEVESDLNFVKEIEPSTKTKGTTTAIDVVSNVAQENLNTQFNMKFLNSVESIPPPSPAGSFLMEQFDATATPLSLQDEPSLDSSDNLTVKSSNSNGNNNNNNQSSQNNNFSTSFQCANTLNSSFTNMQQKSILELKFKRNNSQTSMSNSTTPTMVSPLTITPNNLGTNERVCSSPINGLKMSSRVCQIKIDEGIEPHLSREIKSEREIQNTLKLKSSCDELMLNSDELEAFSFENRADLSNRNNCNSPSGSSTQGTFKRYRTFSESFGNGNIPSPSLSCHSYSNSSSPTGALFASANTHQGSSLLQRCHSPSTTLINNNNTNNFGATQLCPNYFSQSPSPTRKLFVTRRSMSPIPCSLRPSSLGSSTSSKRKFSEVDQTADANSLQSVAGCSPKRSNNESEFVQPLVIYTGTNPLLLRTSSNSNRSETSSPCSTTSITTTPSSPYRPNSSLASLIITTKQDEGGISESNKMDSAASVATSSSQSCDSVLLPPPPPPPPPFESSLPNSSILPQKIIPLFPQASTTAQQTNRVKIKINMEDENKYTFVPIQLPHKRLSELNTSSNAGLNSSSAPLTSQVNNAPCNNSSILNTSNDQSPVNIGDSSPASIDSPLVNTSDSSKLAVDSEFTNQQQQHTAISQNANNSGCSESSFLS